jgi:hypothetical protein
VQCAHATYEAGASFSPNSPTGNYLLVHAVHDECTLMHAAARLEKAGIRFALFQEPDMGNQYTALCTEPMHEKDPRRRILRAYPLWVSNTRGCGSHTVTEEMVVDEIKKSTFILTGEQHALAIEQKPSKCEVVNVRFVDKGYDQPRILTED